MKKDNEREEWIKRLHERLENYEEPFDTSDWKKLEEKLLPDSKPSLHRIPFYRRPLAVASIIALVIVSSALLWMVYTPSVNKTSGIGAKLSKVAMPIPVAPAIIDNQSTMKDQPVKGNNSSLFAHASQVLPRRNRSSQVLSSASVNTMLADGTIKTGDKTSQGSSESKKKEVVSSSSMQKTTAKEHQSANNGKVGRSKVQSFHRRSLNGQQLLALSENKKHYPWSIALSAGGGGGAQSSGRADQPQYDTSFLGIPNESLLLKEGASLNEMLYNSLEFDHHQPISFGVSFRKFMSHHLSVETGLVYTLLVSDVSSGGELNKGTQQLHYIGIPLKGNWIFLTKQQFQLYLSIGGTVEKCVYGKLLGERLTINPLQFSVNGGAGVQYDLSHHLGLFAEAGLSYYFNDGSEIKTIRKDSPCSLNLNVGLRLSY